MGLKLVKLRVPSLEPEKESTKQRDRLSQIKVVIVFCLIMKMIEGRKTVQILIISQVQIVGVKVCPQKKVYQFLQMLEE